MYTIIYFSPTGNTKFLAKNLSELLDTNNVFQLDKTDYDEIGESEHLILMYPIHGFNPPRTVKRFIKHLPEGLFNKVSLIAVGCNELWVNDAVSLKLRKYFTKKNTEIVVDEVLAMPLTFVMKFPDDVKKKTIEEASETVIKLAARIKENDTSNRKIKFKSKVINLVGKMESPAARMFGLELHAKKSCTSCGICWNNCPEFNIKPNKKNKPKFGFSCSMCMRCIYNCPEKSITPYLSKFLTIKGGYQLEDKQEI